MSDHKILDSWKREVTVVPKYINTGYEQQLELQLNKTVDATPEEFDDWYETELKWWGDRQLKIVAIATIVQISALAFMASIMLFNQTVFG